MRSTSAGFVLALIPVVLLLSICHAAAAQVALVKPAAPAKKSPAPPARPAKPQELVVPFWTLEPGWATHLELRNNLANGNIDITPVLRTSDGTELPLPPVKLGPDRAHPVDLHAAASSLSGRAGSYGSVVLRFTSASPYNVYAAVMIQRLGHAITFHFDAFPVFQNFSSGSRETIWWLPQPTSDGFLVISNFDSKPARARQTFTGNKTQYSTDLTLAPHQTQRISIRDTVRHAGFTSAEGGIKLDFESGAGSVFVAEVLFDETANFSALMKVFERDLADKLDTITIRAPLVGLATPDPMLGYPQGTILHPTIFVRNVTDTAISPTMLISWKSAGSTGKIPLELGKVAAEETRLVDLNSVPRLPPDANWANVEITYSGRLGDLIAIAASYDDSKRYGLQSPFSSSISYMWKAGMWHVDPTHDTLITTGNGGQKNARVAISLFYGDSGVYQLPEKLLLPGQQTWVNLGDLIRNQIADKNGRVIPPGVMEGSYEIKDLDAKGAGYLYEGKTITDKTLGHATYGCAECCMQTGPGYNSFDILDNPIYGGIGDQYQFYAAAVNVCANLYDDVAASDWLSSDTSVATIDYSTGNMSFVGAGTTTVSANSRLSAVNNCCCRPQTFTSSATATIHGNPDHLKVVSDLNGALQSCPSVILRTVKFGVVDILGTPVPNTRVQENFVSITTNSCGNGQPVPSACDFTDSYGQFTDFISITCGGASGPAGCGYNLTDHWEWCPSSGSATNIGTLFDVTHKEAITVNEVTTPLQIQTGTNIYPQ